MREYRQSTALGRCELKHRAQCELQTDTVFILVENVLISFVVIYITNFHCGHESRACIRASPCTDRIVNEWTNEQSWTCVHANFEYKIILEQHNKCESFWKFSLCISRSCIHPFSLDAKRLCCTYMHRAAMEILFANRFDCIASKARWKS